MAAQNWAHTRLAGRNEVTGCPNELECDQC